MKHSLLALAPSQIGYAPPAGRRGGLSREIAPVTGTLQSRADRVTDCDGDDPCVEPPRALENALTGVALTVAALATGAVYIFTRANLTEPIYLVGVSLLAVSVFVNVFGFAALALLMPWHAIAAGIAHRRATVPADIGGRQPPEEASTRQRHFGIGV